MKEFEKIINAAWENRDKIDNKSDQSITNVIKETKSYKTVDVFSCASDHNYWGCINIINLN